MGVGRRVAAGHVPMTCPGLPDLLLVLLVSALETPEGQGPTVCLPAPSFQGSRQVPPCGQLMWPQNLEAYARSAPPPPGPLCPPGRAVSQSSQPL